LYLSPADEVHDFNMVSWLNAVHSVLAARENVSIHFNGDASLPEPEFFNQVCYCTACAAVSFFAIEHHRHGVSP
jgi:hypothetical protein